MKILYLAHEEIPGRMGGSVHAWEVARGLAALGHGVTLLVHRGEGQAGEERREGVRVVRVNLKRRGKMIPLLAAPTAFRLARDADLVMERYLTQGGAGALIARGRRKPLVLEVNSPHVEELIWRWGVRLPLARWGLRRWVAWQFAAARLAVAPQANIVPEGARDRVRMRGWGVDVDRFRPEASRTAAAGRFRARYGLEGRVPVLFSGSFRSWHGVRHLPEIARRTLARAPEVKFVLVGEGDLLEEVRGAVAAAGLKEDVIVPGSVPHEEMPSLIASCALGLAPYDTTAYPPLDRFGFFWSPLKVFEYLACGIPVILSAYDGLRDHVGEAERGLAVTPGDPEAFAGAVALLARDAAARRRMGQAGRAYAIADHSWAGHVRWLDGHLREVTDGGGAG
jgi:glycosyltransferase involved in cell wall biosynthesis